MPSEPELLHQQDRGRDFFLDHRYSQRIYLVPWGTGSMGLILGLMWVSACRLKEGEKYADEASGMMERLLDLIFSSDPRLPPVHSLPTKYEPPVRFLPSSSFLYLPRVHRLRTPCPILCVQSFLLTI